MVSLIAALATMTALDVRRRGDSLRCSSAAQPGARTVCVLLWDRFDRMGATGHPVYERGFLCIPCAAVYDRQIGLAA